MTGSEGWTALHYSARNRSYELLTYLADKETDFYIKSNSGWNCLHVTTLCRHLHLCKNLINTHNLNACLPDNEGWNAFHFSEKIAVMNYLHILSIYERILTLKTIQDRTVFT